MSPNHRSRSLVVGSAVVLALTLLAPVVVRAEDEVAALAPVTAPAEEATSVDEVRASNRVLAAQRALLTSGIGSMQEERLYAIVAASPSWDETSGYGAVEASRAAQAQQALRSPDLGSLQEETLMAVVATAMTWDETSGYGSVEASRATNALAVVPAASTNQVPRDVRWAPARVIAPGSSWDETSGYGSVEASRAARASRSMVPAPSAAPTLSDVSVTTQTSNLFTVSGAGFTAGGRVYLAIYDQMGAQLYETRWITASLPVLAVMGPTGHEAASITGYGGTLRASFANLCGATAMMRGYDQITTTWSNWLPVEPACAAYVEPRNGPR